MSKQILNLSIAELIVTSEDVVVSTVLGSCVSVCLFANDRVGGGIIHFALPKIPNNDVSDPFKYGDYAIEKLVQYTAEQLEVDPRRLVAKIVGGANNIGSEHASQKVGQENVNLARKMLAKFGIAIVGEDVGGGHGRKILFHTLDGRRSEEHTSELQSH